MSRCLILLLALVAPVCASHAWAEPVVCATLPENIDVPAVYQARVQQLIAQSPTLRRQCLVIASASDVVVAIRPAGRLSANCRARTAFVRMRSGFLRAVVDLPVSRDFAELLAHELEHVIEQIEGVNLEQLAAVADSGVWANGSNAYETERATMVGRRAAREVRLCADPFEPACRDALVTLAAKD